MSIEELKELQAKIIKKDKICTTIMTIFILFIIIILLILYFLKIIDTISLVIGFFATLFISAIIIVIINNSLNKDDIEIFYKNYKKIFVLQALQNIFCNVKYNHEEGFTQEFIDEVGMIDTGDSFYSNDYISGEYKNIKFEQSDIHILEEQERSDGDGGTETVLVTTFCGRLIIFDFNKKFKANLQVSSNYFDVDTLPWGKKFSKVEMEDIEFNNKFFVYAESEHEAFYILTPHFMEKLKEIETKINAGIMFCFVDNKLHIAIDNNTDSFEYNVHKPINEKEIEEDIIKDIKIITDFADELNLDNDLFK